MRKSILILLASTFAAYVFAVSPDTGSAQTQTNVSAATKVDPSYAIKPGDQLNVQVYGEQNLTQTVTVLDDGSIDYPLVGRVQVGGKSPAQAAGVLKTALTRYVKHPIVTIGLASSGPLPVRVEVLGSVDKPGYYYLRTGERLSSAIAQAGTSANAKSDLNHVFITRDANGKTEKQEVNMYNALKGGDRSSDPVMQKDDVVYVPMARQPSPFNPLTLVSRLIGL